MKPANVDQTFIEAGSIGERRPTERVMAMEVQLCFCRDSVGLFSPCIKLTQAGLDLRYL
jgi:hypothetical protein